jgi:hypothetical protein
MANKKKNGQPSKAQSKKALVYNSPPPEVVTVASLVNPFSEESRGTKVPDANASNTFTFRSTTLFTLDTLASSGQAYVEIKPALALAISHLKSGSVIASNGSITTSVIESTNIGEYTTFIASAHKYRIVSWGVRVTCPQSAFDAKGRILIREIEKSSMGVGFNTYAYGNKYQSVPITHDMDIVVLPSRCGESYQCFVDSDVTYTDLIEDPAIEPGFKAISLTVEGGPGAVTSVLQCEVVYNLECIPLLGSIAAQMSTPPSYHSHRTLEAVHNTHQMAQLVHPHKTLGDKIKGFALKALKAVGNFALQRATNYASTIVPGLSSLTGPSRQLLLKN